MEDLQRVTAATVGVLRVLLSAGEPVWGLRVIKGSGRLAGTVYPALERLEQSGWAVDEDRAGPRRRYYELTAEGSVAAARVVAKFDAKPNTVRARPAGTGL